MRIRHKPWAKPELEACEFCVKTPDGMKGKWQEAFPKKQEIHLELGCGKGGFISQLAPENPDINFIAADIKSEMLGLAKRKLEKAYEEKGLEPDNIRIFTKNIENISQVFAPEDNIKRIYINFCNPWPRGKHKKRRLTHPRQLVQYKSFLADDGEIRFKTDDDELFEESLEYFEECGFEVAYKTFDLHNSDFAENIMTEHEKMFSDEGKPIKFLIAVPRKTEQA